MEYEKPLRLSRGGEPSHRPFSLSRRFVLDFGSVIRIDLIDVLDSRHHGPMSRIIAFEFIRNQPVWFNASLCVNLTPYTRCLG